MGGAAGEAFATWLGAQRRDRHRLHLDDGRLRHQQRAVQHGQGAVHDPGPVGDRVVPRRPNLKVNPIPSAGGEAAAPFVGVQGFYLSSQSENALLAQRVPRELPRAPRRRSARCTRPTRASRRGRRSPTRSSSDPIIAGFLASSQTGVPMPSIPEMGSVWELLERRPVADHQRRRPGLHLEHDGHRPRGRRRRLIDRDRGAGCRTPPPAHPPRPIVSTGAQMTVQLDDPRQAAASPADGTAAPRRESHARGWRGPRMGLHRQARPDGARQRARRH